MVSDRNIVKGLHKHAKRNRYGCLLIVATAHYFYSHGVSRCDLTFEPKHFSTFFSIPTYYPTTTNSVIVIKNTFLTKF